MKTKLNKWAEEVISYCNPIAKKNNLEYYPFQSPINVENTEILIVGVNPRGVGDYKCQSTNPKWGFKNGIMPVERLINGNPYYDKDNLWQFLNNLKQIKFFDDKIEGGKFTYMNYFYFATNDANEMKKINGFNDIKDFCVNKLSELIDILKPKLIIVLGVADGLDLITKNTTIVKKKHRLLTKGLLNGITLYGIKHSSRNYAYDERDVLDKYLNDIVKNKKIENYQIPIKSHYKNTNNDFYKHIIEQIKKEFDLELENDKEYSLLLNKDLIIRISDKSAGTIGIRHLNFHGSKKYTQNHNCYIHQTELLQLFESNNNFTKGEVWLGNITLRDLGKTEEDVINKLINILKNIIHKINDIFNSN